MTRINDVKKVLRNTGLEMDADDIAMVLLHQPRYHGRLTRVQVADSLQALCAADVDVIRTRTGLYQHVPLAAPHLAALHLPAPPAPPRPPFAVTAAGSGAAGSKAAGIVGLPTQLPIMDANPISIVAEASYVRGRLHSALTAAQSVVEIGPVAAYLVGLAELRFRRPARLTWCEGSTAAVAEVTRNQYGQHDVIVIGCADTLHEAGQTAERLQRPIRVWTIATTPDDSGGPIGGGIAETYPVSVADLLARCELTSINPSSPRRPRPTPPSDPHTGSSAPISPIRPNRTDLDSLSYLDDTLYRHRIDGVTGRGNSHALKRQALLIGETYASRWWSVVNDDSRDAVFQTGDRLDVPGRLYGDLLTFAESHGLTVHGSHTVKGFLRQGFWAFIRRSDRSDRQPRSA